MKNFFGIFIQPEPWLNILYNLVSFPLGIFYFVFLLTWLLLGFGLLILWVGLPMLLLAILIWWYLAAFERVLAIGLCRTDIPPMKRRKLGKVSLWTKFRNHMGHPVTWKGLGFLFIKFPVGIFQFTITIALISIVGGLLSAPFTYRYWHFSIGLFEVISLPLALISFAIGVVLVFPILHVFAFMGKVLGQLAAAMLGDQPSGTGTNEYLETN